MAETTGTTGALTTLTVMAGGAVQVETVDHEAVRARARELRAQGEQTAWDLSEVLYQIYNEGLYVAWGFADWRSYVEAELDFKTSKAEQYVAIQGWIRAFAPEFVEWVKVMGVTKARLMKTRLTPENAAEWRPRLEGKTYREIEAILAGQDPDAGDDDGGYDEGDGGTAGEEKKGPETADMLRFSLFPEQRRNVELALERAKVLGETDKDGAALDYLATAFLSHEGHYKGLDEVLAAMERSLGVRLIAFKPKRGATNLSLYESYDVPWGGAFMDEMLETLDGTDAEDDEDDDDGDAGDGAAD
jgi:hypothetical protein